MRPRLQDLDTRTLEPIGAEEEEEDEEDGVRLPSPTPRRGGGRGGGFLLDEMGEEDEEGDGVVVVNRAPLERPEGGVGFLIDGGEFMIYSDPKSKTPSVVDDTPRKNTYTRQGNDDDDIMRPPMSSVSPSPSPTRKRRSSEVAESEGELTAVEITPRSKRPRAAAAAAAARGKAKTAKAAHNTRSKDKFLTTDALRDLLPTRKTVKTKTYEILTDYEEEEEVEEDEVDELSRPVRRGRSAKKKVETKAKVVKAKASRGKALTSAKKPPSRMYTKKAVVDEEEGSSDLTPVPSSDTASTIEIGDGVVKKEGRKKLKELKQKFEQVDKWEMEFEDVSQRTLEESSDSLKR